MPSPETVRQPLAEGKTKIIWPGNPVGKVVIIESKDDITAGDGERRDHIAGKAALATQTTSNVFRLLEEAGVPNHFLGRVGETKFRAKQAAMIPVDEVPVANTHPGPLPATAGEHGTGVQEKVMQLGLEYSGPTFHWMDERIDVDGLPQYDSGAQIGHEPVKVTEDMAIEWAEEGTVDALKDEVMRVEKLLVPKWIHLALEQLQ